MVGLKHWWRSLFAPPSPAPQQQTAPIVERKPMHISHTALARFRTSTKPEPVNPFQMPEYAPGVLPQGGTKLAMDDAFGFGQQVNSVFNFASQYHGMFAEGIGFYGYPILAEMAQRSEYRRASEVIAEEMTRKWIRIKATGDDDKSDRVKALEDAMKRYRVREVFREAAELDGFFGMAQIYIDLGTSEDRDETLTPLSMNSAKIARGSLKRLKVIDPTWVAPNRYNSNNPIHAHFYKPQTWFVMGREVHVSRLLTIVSRPVPDMLKPAYNFGGISLSQMMKPYVDNWLRTRQAVSDLLAAFTVWNLETNLMGLVSGAGGEQEEMRLAMFNTMRDNRGLLVTDKDSETLNNISAPLGTLDALQAQSQEHQAAVTAIPLVKLLGITPSGLNASTDGEIRVFYDHIHARQERVFGDHLTTVLKVLQLNEFGSIDDEIGFEFEPLWQLDDAGKAAVEKMRADTDAVYIQEGVLAPEDSRTRLAADVDNPYHGLEGPPPDPPEMMDNPDLNDAAEHIASAGAGGASTGANAADSDEGWSQWTGRQGMKN